MRFHLFLMLFLFFSVAFSFNYPKPIGYVNDYANIIDANYEAQISKLISDFEKNKTVEIAVLTITSLEGLDIETYAVEVFEQWGIGKKKENNGVLILVALSDRRMRIEVGYGLEGTLTDIRAKDIIDNVMRPKFKEEKYGEGIYNAVVAIKQIIETGGYKAELVRPSTDSSFDWLNENIFPLCLPVIFLLAAAYLLFPFIVWVALGLLFGLYINNFVISFLLSGIIIYFLFRSIKIGGRSLSSRYGGIGDTFSDSSYNGGSYGGSWSSGGSSWGGFGGGISGGGGASGGW